MAAGDKFPVVMGEEKAAAYGVATLDADGVLALNQRPSADGINAMSKIVKDYSGTEAPDIDTILDSSFVIPASASKNCPVTGNYIIIYQFFYAPSGVASAAQPRTQIAVPYSGGAQGKGMALRTFSRESVWSDWETVYTNQQPPTAAEVGAAPGGFGLGEAVGKNVASWDEALENGFYKAPAPSGIGTGNIWGYTASLSASYKYQELYADTTERIAFRFMLNGKWQTWERIYTSKHPPTAAEVGAAQSLDIPATSVFSVGWYRIVVVKSKSGSSKASFLLNINHVYAEGGPSNLWLAVSAVGYAEKITVLQNSFYNTQLIDNFRLVEIASSPLTFALDVRYNTTNSNLVHGKAILGSSYDVEIIPQAFTPVEETVEGETVKCYAQWQDPPMQLGVEYRTTERYNGKPVYSMAVNIGDLTAGVEKTAYFSEQSIDQVIRVFGSGHDAGNNNNMVTLPYYDHNLDARISGIAASNAGRIVAWCNLRGINNITAIVQYTKTTD